MAYITDIIYTISGWSYSVGRVLPSTQESTNGAVTGIESLYSQQFSVGIFYFLLFCIVLFTIIVFAFLFLGKTKLKTGEKILFAWILLGVVVAVIFGAAQMLHGYLF